MKYILLEVDINKCTIRTLEGKTFKIKPYDMSVTVSWTPTATLIYNKNESSLEYEPSYQKVKVI